MKMHIDDRAGLAVGLLVLASLLGSGPGIARAAGESQDGVVYLERAGQPRLEGALQTGPGSGLKFLPKGGDPGRPVALEPGATLSFQGPEPHPASVPSLFRIQVGETACLSGMLHTVSDRSVVLTVPWQSAEIVIVRPGAQAVLQRAGEARVFADRFERLSDARWSVSGKPELLDEAHPSDQGRKLRLPAGESSLQHRLAEPLISGRVELSFFDEAKVAPGQRWTLELTFRGPAGQATMRVLLGWAEESLAVESPDGPSLAVQRLARSPGWHRLTLRFGPEQTEIAVDGKELAHGRSPTGPLDTVRIATSATGSGPNPPAGLAGYLGEIQIVRFAEPPTSLEIDPSQDEVRLVVGDQLYGQIRQADREHVAIEAADKLVRLDWSEVAGIYFRRIPAPGAAIDGTLARLEWRTMPGKSNPGRDLDHAEGAVAEISETAIRLTTPYAGTLIIPRNRLARLRVLDRGWLRIIDPCAHHLGDNISTTPPLLDPPLPEGGVLERSFELETVRPEQGFVVLDVVQVVGETSGLPYSNLVQKGELRTYVAVNGKRIDYINHYITTANEATERIRIPIPQGLLKPGKNVLRVEQTGIASDPTWFDDLGILQVAIQFSTSEKTPTADRVPSSTVKP